MSFLCRIMLVKCENLQMFAETAWFLLHWGRQCAAPHELLDAGLGGAPKGAALGLGGGVNAFFASYHVG